MEKSRQLKMRMCDLPFNFISSCKVVMAVNRQ